MRATFLAASTALTVLFAACGGSSPTEDGGADLGSDLGGHDAGADLSTVDGGADGGTWCVTDQCCCNGDVADSVICTASGPSCSGSFHLFSGSQCSGLTCGGPCSLPCPPDFGVPDAGPADAPDDSGAVPDADVDATADAADDLGSVVDAPIDASLDEGIDGPSCAGTSTSCRVGGACVDCSASAAGHACLIDACGCASPADCAAGYYCGGGLCHATLPVGSPCTGVRQCQSGMCELGYCIGGCYPGASSGPPGGAPWTCAPGHVCFGLAGGTDPFVCEASCATGPAGVCVATGVGAACSASGLCTCGSSADCARPEAPYCASASAAAANECACSTDPSGVAHSCAYGQACVFPPATVTADGSAGCRTRAGYACVAGSECASGSCSSAGLCD